MTPRTEDRPDTLVSETQRIETGTGKVYVTITEDGRGRPFEVFVNTGQSGGFTNSWCNALGMVLSVALRSGADPESLIDVLMGVRGPAIGHDNGDDIFSIPDAVGVALKRHVDGEISNPVREERPGGVELP